MNVSRMQSLGRRLGALALATVMALGVISAAGFATTLPLLRTEAAGENTMTLKRTALELLPGETDTLVPQFSSAQATAPAVTFTSADSSVVSVDGEGKLEAKKLGSTTITVSCPSTGDTVECKVSVIEKRFSFDDNILLSIFWPPTPADRFVNDEQYKLIADAGVNWVMGSGAYLASREIQKQMLELCAKYGIGMTVQDGYFGENVINKTQSILEEYLSYYKNVPGAYGFYLKDEPYNPHIFADAYIALKNIRPDAYLHLNFLQSGAYGSHHTYRGLLNDWCRAIAAGGYSVDYLMFDQYPFPLTPGTMDREGFYANLRSVWEIGLKNDVKTGTYIQTVSQTAMFRRPTDSEIRYEMYTALAYGFKQLSFFTWFTPSGRDEPFDDGIISADGVPNEHYEAIKTINHEILAIGPTLAKCDALGVYFSGPFTYGQPSIPEELYVQVNNKALAIVSTFRHKETGRNYLMVVNNYYNRAQTVKLTFDSAITSLSEVSRVDGSLVPLTLQNGKLELNLAAGDAMFIALPEGFDYYPPLEGQPDASVNLALDAVMTSSDLYSSQNTASGWYLYNLNDGERFDDMGKFGKGWRTLGTKDAWLTIDLGSILKFNRIDLYACENMFEYGTRFPRSMTFSVSNDGESWTPVKTYTHEGFAVEQGMKIDLGEQTARYIRIDIAGTTEDQGYADLFEIEVYNDDGTLPAPEARSLANSDEVITYRNGMNLALGRPAFTSSSTEAWGFSLSYLNDGKIGTGYSSATGRNPSAAAEEFVAIELGDVFALDTIKIHPLGTFAASFKVTVSKNGVDWVEVYSANNVSQSKTVVIDLEEPVEARYVRLVTKKLRPNGIANDGYLLQIGEIEVFGSPSCDKTELSKAIAAYEAGGFDTKAALYTEAKSAMENDLLTASQARDLVKRIVAIVGEIIDPDTTPETETNAEPDTTVEPETTIEPETTTVEPGTTVEPETTPAAKKGCGSSIGTGTVLVSLVVAAGALALRKKREE